MGLPGGSVVKNLPANEGDPRNMSSIPGLGRSPREVNGNPLQYSCLENPNERRSLAGHSPWDHQESNRTEHAGIKEPIMLDCWNIYNQLLLGIPHPKLCNVSQSTSRLTSHESTRLSSHAYLRGSVAEIQPLYMGTELNLRDRVLGEVDKNCFIALSGKGGHSKLVPSKLCVHPWRG